MIEVKMYECEFCHKKRYKTKPPIKRHEDVCYFNPKNKACVTCNNYDNYNHECTKGLEIGVYEKDEYGDRFLSDVKLKYKCSLWKYKN